jgi:hypothetical protein
MRLNWKKLKRARVWAPVVAFATFACISPPLESPTPQTVQQTPIRVAQNIKNQIDVLFMVDNSASMSAMSDQLKLRFNEFFKVFQNLDMMGQHPDMQIGVVTSDFGAGLGNAPGCSASPGGQHGYLQSVGQYAASSCMPPQGAPFIKFDFGSMTNNLPAGQDLVATFTCMASVVTTTQAGCGFEHQLESVYAALHNNYPQNAGFLRDGALLAVVFLTNEDDASAPQVTDLFDKSKIGPPGSGQYGYEDSYSRQTRFAILCNGQQPPYGDSGGPLSGCVSAPNPNASETSPGDGPGKQYDIQRYIDFFTKPASAGGVKVDPNDVILVGIDAAADPFQVILSDPATPAGTPYQQCAQLNEQSNPACVPVLQHSCVNSTNPSFFGDPAVRLNTVINSAINHSISSICADDYTGALQTAANLIVSAIGGGCIPSCLTDLAMPDCVVEDVTTNQDGTVTVNEIPSCTTSGGAHPCWSMDMKSSCTTSPQGVGVTINRDGAAPPNTNARVSCATIAGTNAQSTCM